MRKRFLPLLLLGVLLAACGGSHDAEGPATIPLPPPPGGGVTAADVFTLQVASLVVNAPDDAEPMSLDATVAAMPEDAEPQALQ